ncbi:diguanylate cyclase (GGDEF)-like protein [Kineococcus xinjiangensis]|uniref:Diguanylate cyclase (GGDEF)-like protein n=1 Tax=Kineococcus xinjiangensis TaxID=512762 RepID=A0A2S6IF97_9ACTN|nr:bifunctional diguanylate cyclase/phosphodiesterase [Kineococcus xinjiangensis]PPK92873.1 diguanylate cyclase (GGDEF)-like protein [Kineococcus xinjiangensis]
MIPAERTSGSSAGPAPWATRCFPLACLVVLGFWPVSLWLLPPLAAAVAGLCLPAVMALGLHVHRPAQRLPWVLLVVSQGFGAVSHVVAALPGAPAVASQGLAVVSHVTGSLVVAWILVWIVRRRASARRGRACAAWLEALVLAAVVGLVAAHVLAERSEVSLTQVASAANLLLLGVVLRYIITIANTGPAVTMLHLCGLVAVVGQLLQHLPGERFAAAYFDTPPLAVPMVALLTLAAAHPSMVLVFDPDLMARRRSASVQMLALLPLVALPPALWLMEGHHDGTTLPVWLYLLVGALVAALGLLRGALALRATERRAARDPLTDLLNRNGLAQAFAARRRPAAGGSGTAGDPGAAAGWVLCLLDVDDFKHVNDSLGHDVGDTLILEVARRLTSAVGPADAVARTGGDEFVLLLAAGTGASNPEQVLDAVFTEPFALAGRQVSARASTGLVPVEPGSSMLQLLADADVAMYAAKAAGGGTVAFTEDLRRQVLGRRALVEDLRVVLTGDEAERVGGLHVVYQPLVDMGSGDVLSCEALVRWEHPTRGRVMPDQFLSAAEDHGLGVAVDRAVLRAALAQLVRWDAAGLPPLSVSVNLGRSSTCHPGLALDVLDALAEVGLPASRLRLEITEHEHLPNDPAIAEEFQALVAAGVGLSLDDFGAGYASLDYLLRYPVSTLKLDRCITAPLMSDPESPLLEGVVGLAARLGLTVLAEGVETAEQRERLAGLGIDHGQGWYFARPLSGDDFAGHVLERTGGSPDLARA